MKRLLPIAVVLGLLAGAPAAQARDEGIEACVTVVCDGGLVHTGGTVTFLTATIERTCGSLGGVHLDRVRACFVETFGGCEARAALAGLDGVVFVGTHSSGCAEGSDSVVIHLLH